MLSSYSKCIYPIENEIDWIILYHIRNKVMLPPKTRRPTKRPRKVRISSGEEGKCTSHLVYVVNMGIIGKHANDQSFDIMIALVLYELHGMKIVIVSFFVFWYPCE